MAAAGSHTLPKEERLSGKTDISALLGKGRWGSAGDIRYCWTDNGGELNRIMVSVPKRHFKRAVKRNLLKRRIREAYRTRKDLLTASGVDLMFVWSCPEVRPFDTISGDVAEILREISSKTRGK